MYKNKICLLTTTQPTLNPRIVKEADALQQQGYEVVVVGSFWVSWAFKADQPLLKQKQWKFILVGGSPYQNKVLFFWTKCRYKLSKILITIFPQLKEKLVLYFSSRAGVELMKEAVRQKADLYIAHNLGALPVAVQTSKKVGACIGFDAEDFHSKESYDEKSNILNEWLEKKYLSQCDYLTAASSPMADAYRNKYQNIKITSILNVFSIKYQQQPSAVKPHQLTLYWFSQTIGPDRGVEDVVMAMSSLKGEIHLYLQGEIKKGYQHSIQALASRLGLDQEKIHFLPVCPAEELLMIASQFDVGLALERTIPYNRDLCVTNKIFSYLLSGLSIIATNTQGQRGIVDSIGEAGWLYNINDIDALRNRLEFLLQHPQALMASKKKAFMVAQQQYHWELEQQKFLNIVKEVLLKYKK